MFSHRPYAVAGMVTTSDGQSRLEAVWFRRKHGSTAACTGYLYLWHWESGRVETVADFLSAYNDNRFGGHCLGRWDGKGYWGSENPEVMARHLELLRPMLNSFPAIPEGYDGWWVVR